MTISNLRKTVIQIRQDTNCTLHSEKFEEGNPSLDVSRETSDCARLGQAGGLKAAAGDGGGGS